MAGSEGFSGTDRLWRQTPAIGFGERHAGTVLAGARLDPLAAGLFGVPQAMPADRTAQRATSACRPGTRRGALEAT